MITRVWYSIQNGGDGSAYPVFCESEQLAHIIENYQYEGWGEDCVGCLQIESESPIKVVNIRTADEEIEETKKEIEYDKSAKDKLNALLKLKGK